MKDYEGKTVSVQELAAKLTAIEQQLLLSIEIWNEDHPNGPIEKTEANLPHTHIGSCFRHPLSGILIQLGFNWETEIKGHSRDDWQKKIRKILLDAT